MNKKDLSERDICTKFITPAILGSDWTQEQFREEVNLTDGRVLVQGNMATRVTNPEAKGGPKRADYVLYAQPHLPIAVLEAKRATYSVGHGMQQALLYAELLDAPFAISSNGESFLIHDRSGQSPETEWECSLENFPRLEDLWPLYLNYRGISQESVNTTIGQAYYSDSSGKESRYYQQVAINRTLEAISQGQERIMLVMATGTGKTYTAFQIIWRLWKSKTKKRILFLADRNILVDQTMLQDFAPFGEFMHKITNRQVKRNYEIYLSLYQAVTGQEEAKQIFRQFSPDFFDLVVVDECHRGSAKEDSSWREVLEYFSSATHIGLTATPKEKSQIDETTGQPIIKDPEFNYKYFGEPIYTYSLAQGIDDGFLAPYKVIRVISDVDALGYRPEAGKTDKHGQEIEQRIYNTKDFDRKLILEQRTDFVAKRIWDYLCETDPLAKTIVFCDNQDHAERMRQALVKIIPAAANNRRYVMRITGDDKEGKNQLSYFIDNDETYPVIATTSKLLTTGVDAKTCKVIALDQTINSMTEFKQIIGRGTRIREDYHKLFFTIIDFKGATRLFADPEFDGEPVLIYEPRADDPMLPPEDDGIEILPSYEYNTPENVPLPTACDERTGPEKSSIGEAPNRYVVDDVKAQLAIERSQYLGVDGILITEDYRVLLKENMRKAPQEEFGTLSHFLKRWSEADRKQAIIDELEEHGVSPKDLSQAVPNGDQLDVFDLVAHVAFDQKPLTRRERALAVKKRDVFTKYGDQARAVLDGLLEKFADHGVRNLEDPEILDLPPFDEIGSKMQIWRTIFNGPEHFQQAIHELEAALYDPDISQQSA